MSGVRNLYALLGRAAYWLGWPASWIYLRGSRRTRLLLMCGDDVLLVKNWLGTGKWALPGGGLHAGEDPQAGLMREVREETSIDVGGPVRKLGTEPYAHHGFRYQCHYFAARLPDKPAVRLQRLEIVAAVWMPLDQVSPQTCGADVVRALQLLDTA
ncbi:MAG TPA: NUDIX hydrolase [Candidatus Saccharimonadales bacterium]|nr:NUDIX hydrolase [Candidatus Saccharimonadales bacterium]